MRACRILLPCLLAAPQAAAQGALHAVVATDGCIQGPTTAAYVRAVRGALIRRAGVAVQSEAQSVAALGGAETQASLSELARRIEVARQQHASVQWDRAERTVKSAIEELKLMRPSPEAWLARREAVTLQAWICLDQRRRAESDLALLAFLQVDPDYAIPPTYPPSLRSRARSLRETALSVARADVTIRSKPPGLTVYVDGKPLPGKTPLTASLPVGAFTIAVGFPDHRGMPKRIEVPRDEAVDFEEFERSVYAGGGPCVLAGPTRDVRLPLVARVGAMLGAGVIVALRTDNVAPGEVYLVASVVDVESGQEVREGRVKSIGSALGQEAYDALAAFVTAGVVQVPIEAVGAAIAASPVLRSAPPQATEPAPPAVTSGPAPLRWPAWFALAGAGLAAGTAATFGGIGLSQQSSITPRDGRVSMPYSEAQATLGGSNGSFAVAAGAAGGAVVLGVIAAVLFLRRE